jgi:hypothetical protein
MFNFIKNSKIKTKNDRNMIEIKIIKNLRVVLVIKKATLCFTLFWTDRKYKQI